MSAVGLGLAVVGLLGCSSGLSRADADEAFKLSNPDATNIQAGCVIDKLISQFGIGGLEDALESGDPSEQFKTQQFRAMFSCGLKGQVETEVSRQILDIEDGRLNESDAACVGSELTKGLDNAGLDVLLSGEITDAFSETYFLALQECGALP